jgi:hypothetical protein
MQQPKINLSQPQFFEPNLFYTYTQAKGKNLCYIIARKKT